jgi:hypothetical protein
MKAIVVQESGKATLTDVPEPSNREVIRMLEARRFPDDDVISAVVPIEDAPEMLRQWSSNPAAFTKIMVQVS